MGGIYQDTDIKWEIGKMGRSLIGYVEKWLIQKEGKITLKIFDKTSRNHTTLYLFKDTYVYI